MSGSLNKAMIIGNLGKDPEIRTVPNGDKVANFSIATNESYYDKSKKLIEKTEWHRVVLWRKLADITEQYLKKGSTVYIEGKLTTRSWDDQNNQKHYTTEIVGHSMQMLSGRPDNVVKGSKQPVQETEPQQNNNIPSPEDELPF